MEYKVFFKGSFKVGVSWQYAEKHQIIFYNFLNKFYILQKLILCKITNR